MTLRGAVHRVSWGLADQAVSSLSNFAVGVLVARTVDPDAFGAFSVAFTTYTIALITSRALASEPFMVRHSATGDAAWLQATRGSSSMALSVGAVAAGVVAMLGLLLGGQLGVALIALAVVLPGLLAQDMWRFAYIAQGRSDRAFRLDLWWLLIVVPGLLVVDASGSDSLAWPIIVWGGAGGLTALGAAFAARSLPTFRAAITWMHDSRDLGWRYVVEALVSLGAIQVATYAVVASSGLAAAGALRGGQLLLGPMQVLLMGIGITAVPEGVRLMGRHGPGGLRRPAIIVSACVAVSTLTWGLVVQSLPDEAGTALLGETWGSARALVMPLALAYAAGSLGLGAGIGLRVLADSRRSLRARSIDATAQVVGGVAGAWQLGALGAAFGLAGGAMLGAAVHWALFLASSRRALPPDVASARSDAVATGHHEPERQVEPPVRVRRRD